MVGASKILTVSYGAFSCTLEGFDEPFDTMKSIAEYFRDLAADDRYFGAEPPTPDATILHRIAEREVKRRVEAKIEDNGVILRAGDAAMSSVAENPPPPHGSAPMSAPVPAPTAGLLADESVAAKLARIRSAVARSAAAGAPPLPDIEDAIYVEMTAVRPAAAAVPTAPAAADPAPDLPQTAPPGPAAEADPCQTAELPAEDLAAVSPPEQATAASVPGAAPHAAPVVAREPGSQDLRATAPTGGAPADDSADDVPEALLAALASLAAEAPAGTAMGIGTPAPLAEPQDQIALEASALADRPETAQVSATVSATVSGRAGLTPDAADQASAGRTVLPVAPADVPPDTRPDPTPASVEDPRVAAGGALVAEPDPIPGTADMSDDRAPGPAPRDDTVAGPSGLASDAGDAEAQDADATRLAESLRRARARVIKVRRPDSPAGGMTGSGPGDTTEGADADTLSPARREGRAILGSTQDADAAVNRLLRHTNSEMDGAESRRRLSTIAHLKAAVAATVADLRAPAAARSQPSRAERYRADLASVVYPGAVDAQASGDRLEPLVLDAGLRIDRSAPRPVTPPTDPTETAPRVLPRRITTVAPAPETGTAPQADARQPVSTDFAAFADRLGASNMPDLLEAAAAYTTCVEGMPHFTRPHLMRHVADLSDRYLGHREDEMRGFGELLRQGRIEKLRRGQFVIPETSRMLAQARRLGD